MNTSVRLGGVALKNPLLCGSGEHTMTAAGMRAALRAGAGAVIAKSTNESNAARQQLDATDYVLLDSRWRKLPWDFHPPEDAQLFCRSGLVQEEFGPWLEKLVALDREAKALDSYVAGNLILADLETCAGLARQVEQAGLRILVLNIGAPHGDEAAKGAIVLERSTERVKSIVARIRKEVSIPLWVKLTGQSEDVAGLAQAAKDGGADAVILMGRFMALVPDIETRRPMLGTMAAIGGPWALAITCRWLAMTRKKLGADYPLIATNGARDGLDVARFLLAGASAVEMTSAVVAGGVRVVEESVAGFAAYCARQGVSAQALVGEAADRLETYQQQELRPGYWREFVSPELLGD
jgi:dihydropyrimidine dehydrogenase (NAD+) subunit PreA/dihydroorotate dehydrogenase (NAD+) catalytic subunit